MRWIEQKIPDIFNKFLEHVQVQRRCSLIHQCKQLKILETKCVDFTLLFVPLWSLLARDVPQMFVSPEKLESFIHGMCTNTRPEGGVLEHLAAEGVTVSFNFSWNISAAWAASKDRCELMWASHMNSLHFKGGIPISQQNPGFQPQLHMNV